jgi:hypothetical protein
MKVRSKEGIEYDAYQFNPDVRQPWYIIKEYVDSETQYLVQLQKTEVYIFPGDWVLIKDNFRIKVPDALFKRDFTVCNTT